MDQSSSSSYNEWRVLFITTLTSIATIIGSGILALPVTLHQTSLQLFLVLFTVALICFICVVCAAVELMQRARYHREQNFDYPPVNSTAILVNEASSLNISPLQRTQTQQQPQQLQKDDEDVSLFDMATLYLPNPILRYTFHIATLLSFLGLLVSYGLAGPQALWQITHLHGATSTPPTYLLFLYSVCGTLAVIFFVNALLPFFSTLTVIKGALFTAVVIIVALLPSSTKIASLPNLLSEKPNWSTASVPFLMATVALGALPNTIPVTFRLVPKTATEAQMRRYRNAVIAGLVICYLLNIGWVIAVLQVVPRRSEADGQASLDYAYNNGLISTVPLIATLGGNVQVSRRLLQAVSVIVNVFILVSTTVSFFIMAAGCKSYVDGAVLYVNRQLTEIQICGWKRLIQLLGYVLSFGSMVVTIIWNPNGFISVLTSVTSLTLNLQSGALIMVMLYESRKIRGISGLRGSEEISLSMSKWSAQSMILFGILFFSFASLLVMLAPFLGIEMSGPGE